MYSHDLIITTFNSDDYIKNIIEVIENNYNFFTNFFIIDDYSRKSFFLKLKKEIKTFKKVSLLRNPNNVGVSFSRNRGINLSKSLYISFLDPDDFFHPQKAEIVTHFLNSHKPKVLFHNYEIKEKKLNTIFKNYKNESLQLHRNFIYLFKSIYVTPAFTCKRELLKKINGYDESYRYAEDLDLYIRLRKITPFHFINLKLVNICSLYSKGYSKKNLSSNQKQMRNNIIIILINNLKTIKNNEKIIFLLALLVNHVKKIFTLIRN